MRWYADNSELHGIRDAAIPDILLFGGVVVPSRSERGLQEAIQQAKKKYCPPRAPIKWNFKDLRRHYERAEKVDLFNRMLAQSREIRSDVFKAAAEHEFSIIVSCIETHSVTRNVIKETKSVLSGFSFANGLMRYGLCVRDARPDGAQVILDWPDKGESEPFSCEYRSAYLRGETHDKATKYYCGPLHALGFLDSVLYTTMHDCTILQFADLIVGATRELIEAALGKREGGLGVELTRLLKSKYYGYPESIFGRGINVPSGNGRLRTTVRAFVNDQL